MQNLERSFVPGWHTQVDAYDKIFRHHKALEQASQKTLWDENKRNVCWETVGEWRVKEVQQLMVETQLKEFEALVTTSSTQGEYKKQAFKDWDKFPTIKQMQHMAEEEDSHDSQGASAPPGSRGSPEAEGDEEGEGEDVHEEPEIVSRRFEPRQDYTGAVAKSHGWAVDHPHNVATRTMGTSADHAGPGAAEQPSQTEQESHAPEESQALEKLEPPLPAPTLKFTPHQYARPIKKDFNLGLGMTRRLCYTVVQQHLNARLSLMLLQNIQQMDPKKCPKCHYLLKNDKIGFVDGLSMTMLMHFAGSINIEHREKQGAVEAPQAADRSDGEEDEEAHHSPPPVSEATASTALAVMLTRDRADHHLTEIPQIFTHFSHMSHPCTGSPCSHTWTGIRCSTHKHVPRLMESGLSQKVGMCF